MRSDWSLRWPILYPPGAFAWSKFVRHARIDRVRAIRTGASLGADEQDNFLITFIP